MAPATTFSMPSVQNRQRTYLYSAIFTILSGPGKASPSALAPCARFSGSLLYDRIHRLLRITQYTAHRNFFPGPHLAAKAAGPGCRIQKLRFPSCSHCAISSAASGAPAQIAGRIIRFFSIYYIHNRKRCQSSARYVNTFFAGNLYFLTVAISFSVARAWPKGFPASCQAPRRSRHGLSACKNCIINQRTPCKRALCCAFHTGCVSRRESSRYLHFYCRTRG